MLYSDFIVFENKMFVILPKNLQLIIISMYQVY